MRTLLELAVSLGNLFFSSSLRKRIYVFAEVYIRRLGIAHTVIEIHTVFETLIESSRVTHYACLGYTLLLIC